MSKITLASYWRFLLAGLMNQGQTGAVIPSQRFLITRMLSPVPEDYRGRIFELGAGTGALTLRLAAKCPHARILACEINPVLAQDIRRTMSAAGLRDRVEVISTAAERLLADQGRTGVERPNFIISGIPLGNLGRDRVLTLIERIRGALPNGGMYIQFQHSLIDRKKIKTKFARLRTVPVLLNFPPAVVYYAQK
ncbi:MAG TPA: methyltransferase domain-containing protein [Candidatus Binatia bacterium]|jgi:phosphatidylethanolamine/phosphatidyl-N-methylethanolamine N-methyltransferase|nr:methyltransferase domain-containing protein [Candidatus Binatia bacterium]